MSQTSSSTPSATRFRTIDGLRGIAAFSVAIYHFNALITRPAPDWLPAWAGAIARQGFLGVDVFFVISGFVIAYSVREGSYTAKYLGLFAVRRSIRLDPPYWFAIVLEICLIALTAALFPTLAKPLPSPGRIVSHLFYAQNFLGYGDILGVFWTLCFEIQFYLLFVSLLVMRQRMLRHATPGTQYRVSAIVLAALFGVSLSLAFGGLRLPIPGHALAHWFKFFLGALTWWVVSGGVPLVTILVAYAAIGFAVVAGHASAIGVLPIVVSGTIVALGRARRLDTALGNAPLQFLGKTSYSLYLLHGPIGERWIALLERLIGPSFGLAWAWFAFFSASAISIAASALVWKLIEQPTMRFSKRIRLPSRTDRTPVTAVVDSPVVTA